MNGRLKLRLFVDTSSIEVFVNDGETVLTSLFLHSASARYLDLDETQGELRRANLSAWKLASAWHAERCRSPGGTGGMRQGTGVR